jgi:tetratricopeptide (TPR) repeat protein
VRRAPILRRDAVGAFESRLRWSHRLRWLVPAGALILALAVGAVALILRASGGPGREALRRRAEAMALVAQDDLASLARAEEALQALAAAEPELRSALADAALARVLRASSQDEEAVPSARALADRAREDLRRLEGEIGPDPAVRRASAVAHALAGEREAAVREARSLGEEGGFDRWVELSEALVEIEGDAAARTRGLARLQALVARSPELVRARYLLARAQAESGSRQEALASLEALLAVNPRHERARRFREALGSTGPQVEIARPPAPSDLPAPLAPAPAGAPGAPAAQAAAPAPAPAAGEPPPEVETQPAPSQPTAPVAPASLPVVVPPKPAPARTGQDGEGASEPGGGGDAATPRRGSGTRDHLLPDSGGG